MKSFRLGGIHPKGNKLSSESSIRIAKLPDTAVFMLSQHIGAPAKAIVGRGDKVKVGTMIAEAGGFVSAPIFSSVSGTVAKVDFAIDASGQRKEAIYVKVEGDEWEESINRNSYIDKDINRFEAKEIVDIIKNSGIVGMGGACFPTHVKLCPPPGCKADCIIINAAECEPYLTADHRLMLEHTEEIIVGIRLLMKGAGVNKAYIGIENNKRDAINLLQEALSNDNEIFVVPLRVKYPQGGEKQLIQAITGREVPPPPAIPINVGVIVQNVGTAYAVYEAVMKNKPLFERIVTVTGKALSNPSNLLVRMGTNFSSIIDECGGMPSDTGKIISGGPMMGKAVQDTSVPVCKGTSGVLLMTKKEAQRAKIRPCIKCAKCVDACPMGLEPYLLATSSSFGEWDRVERNGVLMCLECGSCQFKCPSNRPILDMIRIGKGKVGAIVRERNKK